VQLGLTRALQLSGAVASEEAYLWYSTHRAYWGQGYAAEAAGALLEFGFEQIGLTRIFAECHPENRASRRVMDKLGLRPEAHRPEEDERYPERSGFYRAALNAREWSALRTAPADSAGAESQGSA
jgi:RimJ/RimL family protein N-acetyltransferase